MMRAETAIAEIWFRLLVVLGKSNFDEYRVIPANNGAECFELLKDNELPD